MLSHCQVRAYYSVDRVPQGTLGTSSYGRAWERVGLQHPERSGRRNDDAIGPSCLKKRLKTVH